MKTQRGNETDANVALIPARLQTIPAQSLNEFLSDVCATDVYDRIVRAQRRADVFEKWGVAL